MHRPNDRGRKGNKTEQGLSQEFPCLVVGGIFNTDQVLTSQELRVLAFLVPLTWKVTHCLLTGLKPNLRL
jgi:hypothetical protein